VEKELISLHRDGKFSVAGTSVSYFFCRSRVALIGEKKLC
jgi:hypothetical protein